MLLIPSDVSTFTRGGLRTAANGIARWAVGSGQWVVLMASDGDKKRAWRAPCMILEARSPRISLFLAVVGGIYNYGDPRDIPFTLLTTNTHLALHLESKPWPIT